MNPKKESRPFNEAGRMVKAAVVTALARESSIDRTLKKMPPDAGEWAEIAEKLMRKLQGEALDGILGEPKAEKPPFM